MIVRGRGRMEVAGDVEEVGEGDLVFIPPATQHGIVNDGSETLVYVSAASPPVSMAELYGAELAPGRRRLRRRLIATHFFDTRALTGTAVARTVGRRWSRSARQQLVVYAAAALAIALIGARYLKQERDPPAPAARPAGARSRAAGRRRGVRARHRGGAAPGRLPAPGVGAARRRDSARGRRDGAGRPAGREPGGEGRGRAAGDRAARGCRAAAPRRRRSAAAGAGAAAGPISLNTATVEQLDQLEGIGPDDGPEDPRLAQGARRLPVRRRPEADQRHRYPLAPQRRTWLYVRETLRWKPLETAGKGCRLSQDCPTTAPFGPRCRVHTDPERPLAPGRILDRARA